MNAGFTAHSGGPGFRILRLLAEPRRWRLADVCCESGRLRMKLTFVSAISKSSENTDVVEARSDASQAGLV